MTTTVTVRAASLRNVLVLLDEAIEAGAVDDLDGRAFDQIEELRAELLKVGVGTGSMPVRDLD